MVTGDHHRLDACSAADSNSFLGLRSGRIDHTHKTHKGQTTLQLLRCGIRRNLVDFLIADSKDAQCILAHLLIHTGRRSQITGNALGGHHIESTLDDDDVFAVDAVHSGHQLPVRIEGNLRQSGILFV